MIHALTTLPEVDARLEPRTSLFVMATLYADSVGSRVKVRDLSSRGALIEGDSIPAQGTGIRLCRGSLTIVAEIVWSQAGRAGVRFESNISVADWLPGGRAKASQQGVDEVVERLKASGATRSLQNNDHFTHRGGKLTAAELSQLRSTVEELAEDLAADPETVKRHISKLQALDLIAQALGKLAAER